MKWFSFILFLSILTVHLFADINPVAEVIDIRGEIHIMPASMDRVPGPAIAGRSIYNGDILNTTLDSQISFQFLESGILVTASGITKLRIDCSQSSCQIKLNHGNLLLESSSGQNFSVMTKYSEVTMEDNEIWMTRSMAGKDEIYAIRGPITVFPVGNVEQHIETGKRITVAGENNSQWSLITEKMLPPDIYQRLENNLNGGNEQEPFTIMNYYMHDSTITQVFQKDKIKPFNFILRTNAAVIQNFIYLQASFLPMYIGERLKYGYNLNAFIGISDQAKNLNTFSNLSQILAPLTLEYQTSPTKFDLKMGQLNNLSFGYGMLLKRYTNTVSYPMKQDCGLAIKYNNSAESFTFQFFNSSIGELAANGGITGLYITAVSKMNKSVRFGIGIVRDMNQFADVPDTLWGAGVSPSERSVSGYQIDFTYELNSTLLNDTYLFGELTLLSYPANLRYIRSEEGFQRNSSFGILGPGIHWKLGHHRDVKIAFIYSSPLHMIQFFGETYNLERMHYVPISVINTINSIGPDGAPYGLDQYWVDMITENPTDTIISAYYLPKDVYALLNPTYNVYNKIGIYSEYSYNFRDYYEYSFDISVLQEIEALDSSITYYTLGINFFINEGLIKGISECGIYINQYFTSDLLNISAYKENLVLGFKLGINLPKNIFLQMYHHNVFYDNNFDGNVDLNSTMGLGLAYKY